MPILVDLHEPKKIEEGLRAEGIEVERVSLPVGDYLVVGNSSVLVERKTVPDLLNSIQDGRLKEQAKKLKEEAEFPLLLVEGVLAPEGRKLKTFGFETNWNYKSVIGILFSIVLRGVPVIQTSSELSTVYFLSTAESQLRNPPKRRIRIPSPFAFKEDSTEVKILCAFPGINAILAERLLDRFGTLGSIFTASEEELVKVKGMGKGKAKEMRRILWG